MARTAFVLTLLTLQLITTSTGLAHATSIVSHSSLDSHMAHKSIFKSLKALSGSKSTSNNSGSVSGSQATLDHHARATLNNTNGPPFWMEVIKHQGKSPFNSDPNYKVFRNVKVRDEVVVWYWSSLIIVSRTMGQSEMVFTMIHLR